MAAAATTTDDDQYADESPARPRAAPAPLRRSHAWLLLVGVYAAGFTDGVWGSLCTALLCMHVLSQGAAQWLLGWQGEVWQVETVLGLIALAWTIWPPATGARAVGRLRPAQLTVLVSAGSAACVVLAVAVIHDPNWFLVRQLAWRLVQLLVTGGLIAVLAWRSGVTRDQLGLGGRGWRSVRAIPAGVFAVSLAGLSGASGCFWVLNHLIASYTLGSVQLAGESIGYRLTVLVTNAVVEETVCTALLCALLLRAGAPRWQIYTAAGLLRVAFHLYLGVGGLGAALFAVVNARLFLRYRRLLPLIVAHGFYDVANALALPVAGRAALFGGAMALAVTVVRYRPEPEMAQGGRRAMAPAIDQADLPPLD
jgi:hypothetical protein